jgi:hypothetical protein
MLEILKILTEAALKLLNPEAIEKFRREGAQRKLGTSLFRLYIGLMDLIMQGESLLKIVQDAVEHKSLINYSANWRNTYSERLRIGVERQAAVVEKFTTTFAQFFAPLVAVDAEAAELIASVMGIKTQFLDHISGMLWRGRLPLEQVSDDEEVLTHVEHLKALQRKIFTDFLPALAEWSDEHYEKAALYLDAAREQLVQLRASAAKLKKSLETYFSLKDVLPELSDKQ